MRMLATAVRGVLKLLCEVGLRKSVEILVKWQIIGRFRTGETTIKIKSVPFPLALRNRTSDWKVFYQIFVERQYDSAVLEDGSVVVDAGANVGYSSIFYALKFPSATVVALEPELSNYKQLVKNTTPYANIVAVQVALWNSSVPLVIRDGNAAKWAFQVEESAGHASESVVRAVTVNSLLGEFGLTTIDVLKLDIEGAEREVFATADSWVSLVRTIQIELHERMREGCSAAFYQAIGSRPYVESTQGEVKSVRFVDRPPDLG